MSGSSAPPIPPHVYRYLEPSAVVVASGATEIDLATSGGCAEHPLLAEGFVAASQPAARSLLLIAGIAATRFWTPPNMVAAAIAAADPVVTSSPDALRFESFSPCRGVYARFDLDRAALDGAVHREGTTNVDVNAPLRAAVSRIGSRDPLRLRVGTDQLAVTTLDAHIVEKQVPLPERWVRGFAEVGAAIADVEPRFELHGPGLRRFLQSLPASTRGTGWVVPSGSTARLAGRPSAGAIATGGVERLRSLRPLAPFVHRLTAFGAVRAHRADAEPDATVWVATVDGGRVTVALSPAASRGFSGEGGLLHALATARDDALVRLEEAAAGRLGYDVAGARWFPRELPFHRSALDRSGGRLANARALLQGGAVALDADGSGATVTSGADEYRVRSVEGSWRCTCPWWGRHRDDRGPCKHVLATVLATGHRDAGGGGG